MIINNNDNSMFKSGGKVFKITGINRKNLINPSRLIKQSSFENRTSNTNPLKNLFLK